MFELDSPIFVNATSGESNLTAAASSAEWRVCGPDDDPQCDHVALVDVGGADNLSEIRQVYPHALLVSSVDRPGDEVDCVILGHTVHNVRTSNLARDAAIAAGLPQSTPGFSISAAGISFI